MWLAAPTSKLGRVALQGKGASCCQFTPAGKPPGVAAGRPAAAPPPAAAQGLGRGAALGAALAAGAEVEGGVLPSWLGGVALGAAGAWAEAASSLAFMSGACTGRLRQRDSCWQHGEGGCKACRRVCVQEPAGGGAAPARSHTFASAC